MKPTRNYPLLLAGQFLSAFADNAILAVLVGQLTYWQQAGRLSGAALRTDSALLNTMMFIPYILLASVAGFLNDRHPKTAWLTGGNAIKLVGVGFCVIGVWQGFWVQGVGYFVIGVGAAFYGPAKYGLLPEIVVRERLVRANGMVELLTLAAILTGAIGGAAMADVWRDQVQWSLAGVAAIYAGSLLMNLAMTRTPSNPALKFGPSMKAFARHARDLYAAPRLGRVFFGTALFWFCGAATKINFQAWGIERLHFTSNTRIALLGLWLSVGLMIGSLLAGALLRVGDLRATRWLAFGLAGVIGSLVVVDDTPFWRLPAVAFRGLEVSLPLAAILAAVGIVGGLFLIPLNAALQAESPPAGLGKTIAVQNLTDNIGMSLAALFCAKAPDLRLSPSMVFGGLAVAVAAGALAFRFPIAPQERKNP